MAPTIAVIPPYLHCKIVVEDAQGQTETYSGYLTAHSDDNVLNEVQDNFGSMLEDIETVCAVKIQYAELESITSWSWTSTKTPETTQFSTVDQIAALNFDRGNPLKPKGKLNFTFPLFAPKVDSAVLPFPDAGKLKMTTQAMIDIVDYWQKRATVKYDGNGLLYNGFTFRLNDTVVISAPDIVNNN